MHRKKRKLFFPFLTIVSLASFLYLFFFVPPDKQTHIFLFFLVIFIFFFSLSTAILNDKRQGVLIGSGVIGYALLRFFHLTNPLFALLLIFLLITLEFTFRKN